MLPDLMEFHKYGVIRGQIGGKFLARWNFISGGISGVFWKWEKISIICNKNSNVTSKSKVHNYTMSKSIKNSTLKRL